MNYSIITYVLGYIFNFSALFMLLPCLVAVIYRENDGWWFLLFAIVVGIIGFLLTRKKPKNKTFYAREGMVVVALSWVSLSIIGSIPYVATNAIPSVVDALFETVSGFTTSGGSVLSEIEHLSHSIRFWRCFTNWIGGMGILVFIMAVLPYLGANNLYLMRAESTGPSVGKLVPKIQKTAFWLYAMYIGLTVTQIILLVLFGMPLFDAVCDSFATAGTGGFAVLDDSIASYNTAIQVIITIFMFLFGVNFKFYFLIISKRWKDALHMEEVCWYLIIYAAAVALVTVNLTQDVANLALNLRDSAFQVSSIMTSTGFSTVDFNGWPAFSRTLLVLLMYIGGCAGSTSGGIKVTRFVIYAKAIKKELEFQLHPRSVRKIKVDGKVIEHEVLRSAKTFLLLYVAIHMFSVLIISLDGMDLVTNFTAVAACLNDVGPGLGAVGPAGNFGAFSPLSKVVLMFDMLAGRLELIPMILLFYPATWKKQ